MLPFCQLKIQAKRPLHPHRWKCTQVAPTQPQTIGEHLKRRRLALHLMQKDVAKQLGVHVESLKNWEHGVGRPLPRQIPQIIAFLGYNPEPQPASMSRRIVHARHQLGFTQKKLARALGTDPVSVYRWENGLSEPAPAKFKELESLLASVQAL